MDKSQINNILQVLSNIETLDIDKIPESVFKDQDITTTNVGTYLVLDYIVTLKRVIKQFKAEFSDNGNYLPFQYNFQNEFGSGTLQSDLQNLLNLLNQKNQNGLINSVTYLNKLIYYQIANGFWDKSKMKIHKADDIKLNELGEKLKLTSEQLSVNQNNFKIQIDNLNSEKKNLTAFIVQKQQELQQIANNLQTSNTNTNQISQLLNTSTATNAKIEALLSQQTQNLDTQKKKSETQDTYFDKKKEIFGIIETSLNEKVKKIESQIVEFDKKLQFVEDKKSFFEERNIYLQNLIGREVGASLFETFKQRKNELAKPINKWFWIVIGMSVFTFVAILAIFTNGFGLWGEILKDFTTVQLITNTIKTFPFFFLLFYSISQYNKERNFQEEYAFKSAVALTIKAYADIIKAENLKDEMIISSISSVYKSPLTEKSRNRKDSNTIMETAKELVGTAIDVWKKK
ncbi:MAG: hypothetical protein LBR10_15745 [Prevotellaceae bacterium]|jgi:hypothetical protein|nr:hypothetical protein [Prevotellaceae bacterium]